MPFVIVLEGKNRGERFEFADKAIIGRAQNAGIRLDDTAISRNHARIYRSGNQFCVVDLGSSNGTRVNQESVSNQTLQVGDTIHVGGTVLRFEGDRRAPAPKPASSPKPQTAAARPSSSAPVRPRTDRDAATSGETTRHRTASQDGEDPVLEIRDKALQFSEYADTGSRSLFKEDIAQRSGGFQIVLAVVLVAVAAALGIGAYLLTTGALS